MTIKTERSLPSDSQIWHNVRRQALIKELVRYIHLNPLRAGLVKSLSELDGYRWSGHRAVSIQALGGGGRMRQVSKVRRELACRLTEQLGLSFAEATRLLGVSTSAVAKILERKRNIMSL